MKSSEEAVPPAVDSASAHSAKNVRVSQAVAGFSAHSAADTLMALLTEATDCIAVKDRQGRYLVINPAGAKFLGFESHEILGKTDFELFKPEAALKIRETDEQVMLSGETRLFEDALSPLHGQWRYFQAMKCVYRSNDGEVQGVINVVRDVTERKLAEIALREANEDLDQFASIVAHDLQAPLRKIDYFLAVMGDLLGHLQPETEDCFQRVKKASVKMQSLITDILQLSRVKRSRPRHARIKLKELIEEAVQELNVTHHCVKQFFEVEETDIELEANAVQLRQLFINLFSNALKFQHPDNVPHVQVQAILLSSQRCLITVRDNGIGFQEKFLPHIFKPFERLNREQDYPGNGMGLAICARIADRHHGELRAESNLGEGSAFYVELPLVQPA